MFQHVICYYGQGKSDYLNMCSFLFQNSTMEYDYSSEMGCSILMVQKPDAILSTKMVDITLGSLHCGTSMVKSKSMIHRASTWISR